MSSVEMHSNGQGADKQVETVVSAFVTDVSASTETGTSASFDNISDPVIEVETNLTSSGVSNRNQAILTEDFDSIITQIKSLRECIMIVIPVEKALNHLTKIRYHSTIDDAPTIFLNSLWENNYKSSNSLEDCLNEITSIETLIFRDMEPQRLSNLLGRMRAVRDEINLRITKLNFLFVSAVYPAISRREFVKSMMAKIGHRELCEQAEMHFDVICDLVEKLDPKRLINKDFDVLNDEAQAAVSVMTAIETRRRFVEELVALDRRKRNWTVVGVTFYLVLVTALTVIIPLILKQLGVQLPNSQVPLNELRIPLLGIPWPVIIWSLIGSFAAMIYRFNRMSIYDFNDAVKLAD